MNATDYTKDFADRGEKDLIAAVMTGDTSAVERLATKGVNLCAVGEYENTPLTTALRMGQKKVLKRLLELGVDPNFRTPKGVAPAKTAVTFQKDPEFLRTMLEFGLDPNLKSGATPLIFFALAEGNWSHYQMLLDHDADLNIKDGDGSSLVLALVLRMEYERAKTLILRNADFGTRNFNGLGVVDDLVSCQRKFCEDPTTPDCRKRAELLRLLRERGMEIPPGLPGVEL